MIEKELPIPTTRTQQTRTCFVYIDTTEGSDYLIRAVRQDKQFEDGVRTPTDSYHDVTRRFSEIASETITLPGNIVLSAAQIAGGLQMFIDKWDQEVIPGPPG